MFFLAFEGLDGSGKSSLMAQLESYLNSQKINYIKTREPGGTIIGDQLRSIILTKDSEVPSPRTELLLYEASRSQHVDLVIAPALAQKKWVLCDRFTASSVAFQAAGRSISVEDVNWLNYFATAGLKPNLNILLDLTVEQSQQRRANRTAEQGQTDDRMESEANSFHEKVRSGFLIQAQSTPSDWLVLDASLSQPELFEQLLKELRKRQWLV